MARYQKSAGAGVVGVIAVVVVSVGLFLAGWYVLMANNKPSQSSDSSTSTKADEKPAKVIESKSGNGSFSIVLPDGWNNVIRVKDADYFLVTGTDQPEFKAGKRAMVTDVMGYGSDSPLVFSALIHDNFAPPLGEATDFVFGKGDKLVSGKKYVYEFEQDELEGIGYQRIKGDRNYTYVFPLGGSNGKRELRVNYSVYASDPRNNVSQIDDVVRSIRVLK